MANDDDLTLVNECLNGHTEAFGALVSRYQRTIYNAAFRMVSDYDEAQEIAQTAFVKAYEKLDTFNPNYRFFSWLYRITMNEAINHLHRTKNRVSVDFSLVSPDGNPDEIYERAELCQQVQSAICQLSIDYRVVVVLKHFTDLSLSELAWILEIPVKTVKSRLYSARQRLVEIMRKRGFSNDK
jgi:RNA polymerase sigma-70 factor (ECF subfamily)